MALQARTVPATSGVLSVSTVDGTIDATDTWDDLTARIEQVPLEASIRGMFLSEVKRIAPRSVKIDGRYIPFSMYPVREYMQLLVRTARVKYPGKSPGSALLELGTGVYSTFASSISGAAILAIAQRNLRRICEVAPKAYAVTLKPGVARAARVAPGEAVIQLRSVWIFPEVFHTGIWIGAMREAGVNGKIAVTCHSLCDVDLSLRWSEH